jgi:pyridoxine 4-dehydrogenase
LADVAAQTTIELAGRTVRRIGLGTNRLGDSPEHRSFLTAAVEAGPDHVDTAHLYSGGESEATIGATLAPFPDDIVVATKVGYRPGEGDPRRLRKQLEESFERLHTERIALCYLHRVDPETPLEESLRALREYVLDGRIEHVGISEASVEQIERAREVLPVSAVQNEFSLTERQWEDVVDHCTREGIVFVPFFPLRGGGPRAVAEIAADYDATPHQIALAWLLRRSPVIAAIPGTLSLDHLRENLAALDIELADEDYERLL